MSIVPLKNLEALSFYETHGPTWVTNATAIGMTSAQAAQIKADATDARSLYQAQQDAMAAAKTATLAWQAALSTLRAEGSAGIAAIKAKADASADPTAVYLLAQIPPPASGNPLPPPGTPNQFSATLLTSGAVTIKWKMPGAQPGNTYYQVARRLAGEAAFSVIGGSGNKSFSDATLPLGTDSVQYAVTAFRGSVSGAQSDAFSLQFGVNGLQLNASMKLAA